MTDDELIEDFTRIEDRGGVAVLQVLVITWLNPGHPQTSWHSLLTLDDPTDSSAILAARRKVLEDRRYFAVCQECSERNPTGWMHDRKICQGCAQRNHRVVY